LDERCVRAERDLRIPRIHGGRDGINQFWFGKNETLYPDGERATSSLISPTEICHFLRRPPFPAPELPAAIPIMNKLCTFGGAAVGGYAGWFLGQQFGYGVAFALSGLGSLLGVYAGWKLAQRLR
jgi:hypothetical protein